MAACRWRSGSRADGCRSSSMAAAVLVDLVRRGPVRPRSRRGRRPRAWRWSGWSRVATGSRTSSATPRRAPARRSSGTARADARSTVRRCREPAVTGVRGPPDERRPRRRRPAPARSTTSAIGATRGRGSGGPTPSDRCSSTASGPHTASAEADGPRSRRSSSAILALLPAVAIVGGADAGRPVRRRKPVRASRCRSGYDTYSARSPRSSGSCSAPRRRRSCSGATSASACWRCTSPGPCGDPDYALARLGGFMAGGPPPRAPAAGRAVPRPGPALDGHSRGAIGDDLPTSAGRSSPRPFSRRDSSAACRWPSRPSRRGGHTRWPGSSPCSSSRASSRASSIGSGLARRSGRGCAAQPDLGPRRHERDPLRHAPGGRTSRSSTCRMVAFLVAAGVGIVGSVAIGVRRFARINA